MKKIPILGDMEQGLDNSIKELLGPLSVVYPMLKYSLIFSNPASAMAYMGYRSIPYALDGLTSKKAIDVYKSMGRKVGTGIMRLGIGTGKLAFKYGKKAAYNLGQLGQQQMENIAELLADKDFSFDNVVNNFKEKQLTNNANTYSNNYYIEEPVLEDVFISKEQTRIENNIRAASFLYGFDGDAMIKESRLKIKDNIKKYEPHIKDFENEIEGIDKNYDKAIDEDVVEILPNGNVRYRDADGSITTRFATPMTQEEFEQVNSKERVSIKDGIDRKIFKEKDLNTTLVESNKFEDIISIGADCSVIFTKNEDGTYMQSYRFGDNVGQGLKITEEHYKQFKLDASILNKDKEKEIEREEEFSF